MRSLVVSTVIVYTPLTGPVIYAQLVDDKAVSFVSSKRAKEVVPQRRAGSFLASMTLLVGTVKVVVAVEPSITEIADGAKTSALIVAVTQGSTIVIVNTIF